MLSQRLWAESVSMTRTDRIASDDVYRTIVENAEDFAIFFVSNEGRILTWNVGAGTMFGHEPGEIVGSNFSQLFVPEDVAAGVPERELENARTAGRAEDTRWHLRRDSRRIFCDGVTLRLDSEGEPRFAKIARDVTDRHLAESRLATQFGLMTVLSQELPSDEAARRIMQSICETLRWDIGALWEVDESRELIRSVDHWADPGFEPDAAERLVGKQVMSRGMGLPGEVWVSGQPKWVRDFAGPDSRYPRASVAAAVRVQTAFCFPILVNQTVVGVMEFFSRDLRDDDPDLIPVMRLLGAQIGESFDRRRTLVSLRESEERYRVVSQTAPDAIFTIDASSKILFCNPAVERVFGYDPAELIGQPLDAIIPQRFRSAHHHGIHRYMETGHRHIPWSGVDLTALHRDGHEFPVEISFAESTGPGGRLFTGFARDITERARAAAELARTLELEKSARSEAESVRGQLERRAAEEQAFRHLASALNGAVETADVMTEIVAHASLVTRADGVYVERIISPHGRVRVVASSGKGAPVRGLEVDYPGSMTEEIIKGNRPVILADMKSFGGSMAPYLKSTCPNCEFLVAPLVAEDEALGALVLLNSSGSGRHFGESDVMRARTLGDLVSLALRRVRLMEREREARQKAEAAVRVRDETLGIVSHDLRNPLTKISLSAELLADSPVEEHGELIATIHAASKQAQRLIQDLLDVARVEAGHFSVRKALFDTNELVREVCGSNEPLAQQHAIRIVSIAAVELPELCADRDRLIQVFGNLIGNAIKFSPAGGVIEIDAQLVGNDVAFSVSDSGPGIPESDVPNLFRAYWQAKKTAHMGAGLGLAIVRGIVEAHGGRVWAANAHGGGAVFTFTVPV